MEKAIRYKQIIGELVEEIYKMAPSDEVVETQIITDHVHGHYLLFSVGWEKDYREYTPFLHLDVKPDGKVLLQHDGTDLTVAQILTEKGIPPSDIVLAFRAPELRQWHPQFAQA